MIYTDTRRVFIAEEGVKAPGALLLLQILWVTRPRVECIYPDCGWALAYHEDSLLRYQDARSCLSFYIIYYLPPRLLYIYI